MVNERKWKKKSVFSKAKGGRRQHWIICATLENEKKNRKFEEKIASPQMNLVDKRELLRLLPYYLRFVRFIYTFYNLLEILFRRVKRTRDVRGIYSGIYDDIDEKQSWVKPTMANIERSECRAPVLCHANVFGFRMCDDDVDDMCNCAP